jgi:uncharacterized membrane protein YcaP (DUF421 family)
MAMRSMVLRRRVSDRPADYARAVGSITWHGVGEIVLRTAVVYGVVLLLLRLAGKRELGQMSTFDLTVILLVANAVQNAMVGPDTSLLGGLTAAVVLIIINFVIAVGSVRIPRLQWLVEPPPTPLVRDGAIDRRAMRRELVTREELETALREHGVDDLGKVSLATLEADGNISIVTRDEPKHRSRRHPL